MTKLAKEALAGINIDGAHSLRAFLAAPNSGVCYALAEEFQLGKSF